jgi:hypothetical protein
VPSVKILHCFSTLSETKPIHHVAPRMTELTAEGWSTRYGRFNEVHAVVWFEMDRARRCADEHNDGEELHPFDPLRPFLRSQR